MMSQPHSLFDAPAQPAPQRREFGAVNWMGLWTLYKKEVRRFMKIIPQTLLAPMISNLLYMIVFVLAFSERRAGAGAEDFVVFLAPGLIMLGILNNAAANSSSSIMTGKLMGSINDVLMPPLASFEIALGYIGGACTRGVMVALSTGIGLAVMIPLLNLSPNLPLVPQHFWAILYFGISASLMMAMVGVISGLWAEKFDQLSVVNNFIIMPMSFLSGTFYHIDILPPVFKAISLANPMFYMIDGFRYGFTGQADGNVMIGVALMAVMNLILFLICLRILKSGWRLKA
ncbi:ABC transporter permease [Robiginitomaculum antarcticum]|uniref:ABC transporter permease n=1 Tax=Robiginitomaculum antarcticum TaxID=437507 RepID=UPI000361774E